MENTKKYAVQETVIPTRGVNYIGPRKTKEGALVYLDTNKTRLMVTFALNPDKDDTTHVAKYLDLVLDVELGKKLKEAGLDLLSPNLRAFCRIKYVVQDNYVKDADGKTTLKSLYRVLKDVQVYDTESKTWTNWLAYPPRTDVPAPAATTTTPEADYMEYVVEDDDLPF